MAEELENEETQENPNNAPEPEDLEAIKAQLEQERQARADVEAGAAERDARIAALETELSEAKQRGEAAAAELTGLERDRNQAIGKYLTAVKAANPNIPEGVIIGASIEEIEASLATATSIAEAVRASLEAQAKGTRVPAGAPTRTEISIEDLSPKEKIAYGIRKQGGIS